MRYDLVIFDFDGTLADSFPWFIRGLNEAARLYHFRGIEEHEFDTLRRREPAAIMQHLGMPMWKMPLVVRHVRRVMTRDIASIPLFDGVPRMLHALADAGIILAAVSTNTEANVRAVLGEDAALFRFFGCGAAIFGKAPKIRKVMQRSGVTPERTICIGDELRDIDAARAAGAACGAVTWGFGTIDALRTREPEQVYARVEDITAQLVLGGT